MTTNGETRIDFSLYAIDFCGLNTAAAAFVAGLIEQTYLEDQI